MNDMLRNKPRVGYSEAVSSAIRANPDISARYNSDRTRVFIYKRGELMPSINAECTSRGFKWNGKTYAKLAELAELLK